MQRCATPRATASAAATRTASWRTSSGRSCVGSIPAPEGVSKADFDARRGSFGWDDVPSVKGLEKRWNLRWEELKEALLSPGRDFGRTLAARLRRSAGAGLSDGDVAYALRLIALRLGANTMRQHEYDAELELLEAAASGLPSAELGEFRLPRAGDIDTYMRNTGRDGWESALGLAGLAPPGLSKRQSPGITIGEALEMFLCEVGFLPGHHALRAFTRQKGIALESQVEGYLEKRAAFVAEWRARGRWVADGPPPSTKRPPIHAEPVADDAAAPRANRARWTREEMLAGTERALELAYERGVTLTDRLMRDLARDHPEIPYPSTLSDRGPKLDPPMTKADLRREAERRFAARKRG